MSQGVSVKNVKGRISKRVEMIVTDQAVLKQTYGKSIERLFESGTHETVINLSL